MTSPTNRPTNRTVSLTRAASGAFTARNVRGGTVTIGDGENDGFTPTELLLAAIGSCTAVDVDTLTSRRAEPESFEVRVDADKVRDADGNRLENVVVTFRVSFPGTAAGDAARGLLPDAVQRSHDRLCTVGRTVELGAAIDTRIEGPAG